MRKNKSDYKGIYSDMVEILGEEIVMKLHEHYRGQQITFPMKLYSNEYIEKYIVNNCRNKTLKEMCRDLGYTEGWIKQFLYKHHYIPLILYVYQYQHKYLDQELISYQHS